MKYILILMAFLAFNAKQNKIPQQSIAWEKYSKNLMIIKKSVNHERGLRVEDIIKAISFFERITEIRSESPGDFVGQYRPTQNDYNNWKQWFKANKRKLSWNKSSKKVICLADTADKLKK